MTCSKISALIFSALLARPGLFLKQKVGKKYLALEVDIFGTQIDVHRYHEKMVP